MDCRDEMNRLDSGCALCAAAVAEGAGIRSNGDVTLALGIGANAAIFTLVHAVLLKISRLSDPQTLVRVGTRTIAVCWVGHLKMMTTPSFRTTSTSTCGIPRRSLRMSLRCRRAMDQARLLRAECGWGFAKPRRRVCFGKLLPDTRTTAVRWTHDASLR